MSAKKNFLRTILTTTSAVAVIAGASSNAMGAAARKTSKNANAAAVFTTGDGFSGGDGAFATGATLEFASVKDVTADAEVAILAIDVHGNDLAGGGKFINVTENLTIGSVVDLGANGNNLAKADNAKQAQIKLGAAKTIILNGAQSNVVGFAARAGNAPANNYSALGLIDFNGQAGKVTVNADITLSHDINNSGNAANGTLEFLGAGGVEGTIGAYNALTKVIANGDGTVKLANGTSKATTFEINHANAIIEVAAGGAGKLEGDVIANGGTLKFLGNGEVTGTIGAGNAALTKLTANGANGTTVVLRDTTNTGVLELSSGADVTLEGNTTIDKLTIGDANSHVNIADTKELILSGKQNTTIEGDNIVFAGADSKLTFKAEGVNNPVVTINTSALDAGGNDKGKILLFADGDNGAGGVNSQLIVRGEALGGGKTFRLVSIGGDKIVRLENKGINAVTLDIAANSTLEYAPSADVSFNAVTFADAAAKMKLEANGANRTFALNAHLDPGANNRGTIVLHSNGGHIATLDANGGVQTLGTGAHKLSVLNVTGDSESVITDQVNLTNVLTLNVKNGASLNSKSKTAASIAATNIGEVGEAGTLTIDSEGGNYNLLDGTAITFAHNNSLLKLTNTTNVGNSTVTLKGNVAPGGGNDLRGRLEINSNGTKTLDVDINAGKTIGTNNVTRLNELIVSGDKDAKIGAEVHAKTITISSTGDITFEAEVDGGANSVMNFANNGNVTFEENLTVAAIALGNTDRGIFIEDGKILTTASITSVAGNNSKITFEGDGGLTTSAPNNPIAVDSIKLGANGKNPTLGAGLYTVANIEINDAGGTARFADGFQLTGNINNGAGNAGTVQFLGSAKVTGRLGGGANPVGAVTVAGNNKTLQLGGSVNATSLNGNAGGNQDLKFINVGDIVVDGTVGNPQPFRTIEFSGGGKVTFNGAGNLTAPTTNFHFSQNSEVVTNGFDIAGTDITNFAGKNDNKFVVNAAQTITGNVGTNAQNFGELNVNAGGGTNITLNTANFFAGVTGANAQVIFNNGAGSSVSYLGTGAQKITNANFVQNGRVFGAVNVDTIDVRDNRTATFDNGTFNAELKMHGANSTANFASKVTIGSAMEANAGSDGTLNFNAGAIVNTDIGADGTRFKDVNFAGGDTDINSNIHSDAIDFGANNVTLQKAAIFNGTTKFNGTTVTLGQHDLTLKGGDSEITGNTEIKTTVNGVDLGNLVVGAGGKITLAGGGNALKVTVDDAAAVPVDGQVLKLITKEGNGQLRLDLSKLNVQATGAFSKWITSVENGELVLKQESQIAEVIEEAAKKQSLKEVISQQVLDAIENFEEGTPGEEFVLQLNQMTEPNIADAVARASNTSANEVEKVSFTTLTDVTSVISNRISEIGNVVSIPTANTPSVGNTVNTNNNITGVSSGDQHDRYGIWGTPFYSSTTQKKRTSSSGYKSTAYGGTIGFDVKANDDMLVGMAFSAMNSEMKHKDFKSGDKTKITSYLFSAYATHQFGNNWFGQGVFSIGSSSSDNKENRRVSNTVMQTAQGKYSSMIFSGEVLGGYNHMLNQQLAVTPMFGLNYSRVNSEGYKETGPAGTQLLDVNKQASHKLNLVGGVKLTSAPFIANDVAITPEVHAFVRHDVIGKGAKVNAKLTGFAPLKEKAKLQRTFYNIGAGVNAAYGAMDYGVSADANFADKYVGVQGTLKVRVNF